MSSVASPVIPKEKLSAYQRWELHDFDSPQSRTAAPRRESVSEAEKNRQQQQQAYEAGRAEGQREGAAASLAEAQQLAGLLSAIQQQHRQINHDLANEVLALAMEIAKQMLRVALPLRPELMLPAINDAVARATLPLAAATIALNPADAAVVRKHLGEELTQAGWRIIEDPACLRGGAMLQTASTQIDASMETRWSRLAAALGQNQSWQDASPAGAASGATHVTDSGTGH